MGPLARPAPGFTLVEILVVMVILAVASGLAIATLHPDPRRAAEREASRFGGELEYAAARAQARAETVGVEAAGNAVRFWRRSPGGAWSPVTGDDLLAARALGAPLQVVALRYGGRDLPSGSIVPLRASGRNDPAQFAVLAPGVRVLVTLDPLNRVHIAAAPPP